MIDPADEFLFSDTDDFLSEVDSERGIFLSQIFKEDEAPAKRRKLSPSLSSNPNPEPPEDDDKNPELSNRKKRVLKFFSSADSQSTSLNTEDNEKSPESPSKKINEFPKTPQKELLKIPDKHIFASPQTTSIAQKNRQSVQAIFQQPAKQTETPKSSRLGSTFQQLPGQTKSSSRFHMAIDNQSESLHQHKTLKEIRSPNMKQILQTVDKSLINQKFQISKQSLDSSFKSPRIIKVPAAKSPPEELQVVVRKFPGPAGLLPDTLTLTDSTSTVNYLHILDANEQNRAESMNESRSKDLCTQATKKLFSDGSWRVMTDDLPPNFLENHDIKSIKMSGAQRIPLLAAVIHKFDYTMNPKVSLKDMSDTIDGFMHREVPIKFPNILKPGVVIILGDFSCLAFKQRKSWRKTKVVMIKANNVLGIYGEKERLDSTPTLDAIISGELSQDDFESVEENSTDKSINFRVDKSKENKPVQMNVNKKLKETNKEENKNNTAEDFCDLDFNLDDFDNPFDNDLEELASIEKANLPEKIITQAVIETPPLTSSSVSSESTQKSVIETQSTEASQVWNKEADTSPETPEKSEDVYTGFGADLLMESDSDDELMSQLDVDADVYNSGF